MLRPVHRNKAHEKSEKCLNLKSSLFWRPPENPSKTNGFSYFLLCKNHRFHWFFDGFSGGRQKRSLFKFKHFSLRRHRKRSLFKKWSFSWFRIFLSLGKYSELAWKYFLWKYFRGILPWQYFPMRNHFYFFRILLSPPFLVGPPLTYIFSGTHIFLDTHFF